MSDEKVCMSVKEFANKLSVGVDFVRRLTHVAGFPVIRIGRRCVIPYKEAFDWLLLNRERVKNI